MHCSEWGADFRGKKLSWVQVRFHYRMAVGRLKNRALEKENIGKKGWDQDVLIPLVKSILRYSRSTHSGWPDRKSEATGRDGLGSAMSYINPEPGQKYSLEQKSQSSRNKGQIPTPTSRRLLHSLIPITPPCSFWQVTVMIFPSPSTSERAVRLPLG